jgi:hypothetical protein
MGERWFGAVVFCVITTAALGQGADSAKEARAVIDKAIKAAGGEARLDRLKALTMKIKGPVQVGLQVTEFSAECSFAELDQLLMDQEVEGMAIRWVFNPQSCWRKLGDKVEEAVPDALPELQKMLYATRAATMLVPLKDKAVTLSLGGEAKIGDRPAVIVKAKHKDHGAIELFFDKETGLPAKVKTSVKLFAEASFECILSDYKEV